MIIYKYKLLPGAQTVDMPEDGVVLKVHEQHGDLTIWVESDDPSELAPRAFLVVVTGQEFELPDDAEYVDTAFLGPVVVHVYEVP